MSKDKLLYGLIVLAFVIGFIGGIMVGAKMEKISHSVFVAGRRESLYVGRIVEFRMHDAMSGRQIGVH